MKIIKTRQLLTEAEILLVLKTVVFCYKRNALVWIQTEINQLEEAKDDQDGAWKWNKWKQEDENELKRFCDERDALEKLLPKDLYFKKFLKKNEDFIEEENEMAFLFDYLEEKSSDIINWSDFENKTLLEVFEFFEVEAFDWNGEIFKFYRLIPTGFHAQHEYSKALDLEEDQEDQEDLDEDDIIYEEDDETYISFRKIEEIEEIENQTHQTLV